jgi:hypothetical protein
VFPSEARTMYKYTGGQMYHRITLTKYFDICNDVETTAQQLATGQKIYFNRLWICDFIIRPKNTFKSDSTDFYVKYDLRFNCEILIGKPCIPPDWFVASFEPTKLCY